MCIIISSDKKIWNKRNEFVTTIISLLTRRQIFCLFVGKKTFFFYFIITTCVSASIKKSFYWNHINHLPRKNFNDFYWATQCLKLNGQTPLFFKTKFVLHIVCCKKQKLIHGWKLIIFWQNSVIPQTKNESFLAIGVFFSIIWCSVVYSNYNGIDVNIIL